MEKIAFATRKLSASGRPLSVLLNGHGRKKDGRHELKLGSDLFVRMELVFEAIAENAINAHFISLCLTCCGGGDSLLDAKMALPRGTRVYCCASENTDKRYVGRVSGGDIDRALQWMAGAREFAIQHNTDPARDFFFSFLCRGLSSVNSSSVGISGVGMWNLEKEFIRICGRRLSKQQREIIAEKLGGYLPPERILKVIERIEGARTIWDLYRWNYGPALAATFSLVEARLGVDRPS